MSKARVRNLHRQQAKIIDNLSRELERVKRIHRAAKTAAMALEMLEDPRDQQAAMGLLEPYSQGFLSAAGSPSRAVPPVESSPNRVDAEQRERTTSSPAAPGERDSNSSE